MKTENKFTQGKWSTGGYEIATVLTNQVTITQEFKDKSLSEKEVEEISLANANLIASAPKMYEACILAKFELESAYKRLGFTNSNVLTALNEAIESAEG